MSDISKTEDISMIKSLAYVCMCFSLLAWLVYCIVNKKTPHVLNPFGIGSSCIIRNIFSNFHRLHDFICENLENSRRGTFKIRLPWMKAVVTSNPLNMEYLLKIKFNEFVKGKNFQESLDDFMGQMILVANGSRFQHLRKALMSSLASQSFHSFAEPTANNFILNSLIPKMKKSAKYGDNDKHNGALDMQEIFSKFMFNLVTKVGLGGDPDKLPCPHRAFDKAVDLSILRMLFPKFIWKIMRFLHLGPERHLLAYIKETHSWIRKVMEYRRDANVKYDINQVRQGKPLDWLSIILAQSPGFEDKDEVRNIALSIILAGKDTLSTTLSWIVWRLCKHEIVQDKIYQELHTILQKRAPEMQHEEMFTETEMKEANYIQAVISEVLRLHATVPLNVLESSSDNVLPDGTFVEKGSTIIYSVYAYGRNKTLWGSDADEFIPERWLCDSKFVACSEFKLMVFNAGPRRCLGRDFAYFVMKRVVASIILRFKLRFAHRDSHAKPPLQKLSLALGMKDGLHVIVENR